MFAPVVILGRVNNRNRTITIVIAVVAVLALVFGGLWFARPSQDSSAPEPPTAPTESVSPEASAESSEPASPSESVSAEQCTTTTDGFVPVRYTFEGSMQVDESIVALGEDEAGNIAAPPPAEKRTASWWENGPQPGQPGKSILSIHTYRNRGALGNEMYEGGASQLEPGDLITLYGENGEKACYEFTEAKKIMVTDYDPDSDVMIDFEGDSELAIIICWDFDEDADEDAGEDPWESRVFFYGKLV